ncbi:MAG: hydrogenase nickel incorporation protein HypB, partial [Myxococcota bacterium]|nr:hydrogenase nickel incorporation protein HypB [Myxococcota bacterium]
MCETCGCGDPELVPVEVREGLLADNDRRASHNREHFRRAGTVAVNLMGSPGAGKTRLLERTAEALRGRLRLAALSGDLATDLDADRLTAAGVPARSITTGSACHLDAAMVHDALHHAGFEPPPQLLFVENVGNLVCPAVYDLGQERNVVVLSVVEGEDKPLKYPVMFARADLVVLTKTDLLRDPEPLTARLRENLARVMPDPRVLEVPAEGDDRGGLMAWLAWLE